jgi:hypothetical protein
MILGALTNHASAIEVGAIYRHLGPGSMVEKAHVIEIVPDKMGIPHVRFELEAARGTASPFIESRTLSLEAFQAKFRERLRK